MEKYVFKAVKEAFDKIKKSHYKLFELADLDINRSAIPEYYELVEKALEVYLIIEEHLHWSMYLQNTDGSNLMRVGTTLDINKETDMEALKKLADWYRLDDDEYITDFIKEIKGKIDKKDGKNGLITII